MKKTPTLQTATAICIALAAMFASCRDDKVKITGLDLKELDNVTIKVGETKTMSAKITPASYNAKPDEFTITSTPAGIATATGTVQGSTVTVSVTGVSPGDATVAIKHTSGLQESRVVKIVPPDIVLESIAVTGEPTKKVYELNESFLPAGITVTATYNYGSPAAIALNNADLAFVYDFASAGTKTVTVRYTLNGVTKETNIAGITVNEPEPVLQSIEVNWITDHKNFGIGEPLNSAEKEWTVTATFDKGEPKTIANSDTELEWSNSFSETAGNNKTVTVAYKGITADITGINVLTINQRVSNVPTGTPTTITLYSNETSRIDVGNRNITLIGDGVMRTITHTANFHTINLAPGSHFTLDANVTIDGEGVTVGYGHVAISDNSKFTMKAGSKLTGRSTNYIPGGAVGIGGTIGNGIFEMQGGEISDCHSSEGRGAGAVWVRGGTFTMSGGIITGNTATGSYATGGGVHIEAGVFNMNGGTIVGNTATIAGSGSDVYIGLNSIYGLATFNLSGNAEIGNLALIRGSGSGTMITFTGTFTGKVDKLDLAGYSSSLTTVRDWWVSTQVFTGTLTKAILDRFTLGDFISDANVRTPITGYHLYGTKSGETDTDRFGTLVEN